MEGEAWNVVAPNVLLEALWVEDPRTVVAADDLTNITTDSTEVLVAIFAKGCIRDRPHALHAHHAFGVTYGVRKLQRLSEWV